MSRKDYAKIAGVIYEARQVELARERDLPGADLLREGRIAGYHEVAERLAIVLGRDNPRFDAVRFITACRTGKGAA